MRTLLKILKPVLIVTALSIVLVEVGLMLFDPWVVVNLRDWPHIQRFIVDDPSGFAYPANQTIQLPHWSFTTIADGTRRVPAVNPDGPRVVFVGDSVTFGEGVDDEQTWVNLVASRLALDAVNDGRISYSAENVKLLIDQYPSDCLVFLTIDNDLQSSYFYREFSDEEKADPPYRPYVLRYLDGLALRARSSRSTTPAFTSTFNDWMAAIVDHPHLLLVAFANEYGLDVRDGYGAVLIPHYTEAIGVFDAHPNAAGNLQIADAITPVVQNWLDSGGCDGAEGLEE